MTVKTTPIALLWEEARRIRTPADLPVRSHLPLWLSLADAAALLGVSASDAHAALRDREVPAHPGEMGELFISTTAFFAFYAQRRAEAWAEYLRLSALAGLDDETIDDASLTTRIE